MRYLLLIHVDEKQLKDWTPEQWDKAMAGCKDMIADMQQAGVYLASERLQPTATATTVRVRNGKTLLTDGPFIETKEQLGGFYMIDVPGQEEALEWAKRLPQATFASVEVRAVQV